MVGAGQFEVDCNFESSDCFDVPDGNLGFAATCKHLGRLLTEELIEGTGALFEEVEVGIEGFEVEFEVETGDRRGIGLGFQK